MGQQLALVLASTRRISNWCGVRCTSLPDIVTTRFSRSTLSSPMVSTGSPEGAPAAASPADARAARRSRPVSSRSRRHRRRAPRPSPPPRPPPTARSPAPSPAPQLPADIRAGAVGEDEIEDHRVGRTHRRRGERRSPRCRPSRRRSRRRAGSCATRAGSAVRRRHQHPLARSRPPRHGGYGRQREHEGRALPGRDSAQTRPPFASAKPRAIARPRPAPRASPVAAALEGREDPLSSPGAIPGP